MTEIVQHKRPVRSFVKRQGRMTPSQRLGLSNHWEKYGLEHAKVDWATVCQGFERITLDIGFGMGEGLLSSAQREPECLYVGIEVHEPGVGRVLNQAHEQQIENIRVFCEDAMDVITHAIPDSALDKVQLFFPDPWPKKKHHKRRIVNEAFLRLIAQKLKPAGILHMATDWQDYCDSMQQTVHASALFTASDQQTQHELALNRPKTRFEQRGIRLGHTIHDLVYQKA